MTALNKHTELRKELSNPAIGSNHHLRKLALSLLDELEAAEKRIAEHNFENRLLANADRDINALRQRIAELEAKLETADRLQDGTFRDGLKAGFSYGQTDDQFGFMQCMSAYSTRADIKVKES